VAGARGDVRGAAADVRAQDLAVPHEPAALNMAVHRGASSSTLERYLARQIYSAVLLVLLGFLALFAFFDLIGQLGALGVGDYNLRQIFTFVLLSVPTHAYELFPVVVLIGTLYVLAHLASNSEYTVMRASGLTPLQASRMLVRIGAVFVITTFVIGEWVAPGAEQAAQALRLRAMSSLIGKSLASGLWFKDELSFINIREARESSKLTGVRVYEFDANYRLRQISYAESALYRSAGLWQLNGVVQTRFRDGATQVHAYKEADWRSAVSPDLLEVLIVSPERMSAWRLYKYTQHLAGNRQKTERYEIAMWKKLFYPFATLVMMALALPFAYLQARSGMVGLKVFLGIMLGVFFHMLNSLLAHLGLLQNWPPLGSALLPSVLFLVSAMVMMWWVERR
jgi:lipopolysaccharide export system permease protein